MAAVLLVDDEPLYRECLSLILARAGHQPQAAGGTSSALEIVDAGLCPDILVADWMLSESLNGLDLADTLRRRCPDLGIILITGYPPEQLRRAAGALNRAVILEKPFDLTEFLGAIDDLLTND